MMQDPGREEAASSSASSSATPIQSVEQPAPPCSGPAAMAQMGVVASHQHPGAPALGPGPTASAFYGMPFAGPPRQPTPAASQAGPSGGFQGPSYAGHVHCSPAAAAQAGPSTGFQGAVRCGSVAQFAAVKTCGPLFHLFPGFNSQNFGVPVSGPAASGVSVCSQPQPMSPSSYVNTMTATQRVFKCAADECGICFSSKENLRMLTCYHYPYCNDCIKGMSRNAPRLQCPVCRSLVTKTTRVHRLIPDV
ncbi:E3 ubiquitin-protein ligase ZNRF4 [Frankliniella fusca]|uniref:E3 ubiquitin-protein ligase ZNRF4 n=1 Tax=Frankliniella fusca TaxID=407009 RepID=A0AAE1GYF0_9NEOP|nr:E3 ubiquitin-protein ligase ZNRF4 [Frankliniella fusca]